MDNQIIQHFKSEEQGIINGFLALIQDAKDQNRAILTNFLNPREQYILKTLVNRDEELKLNYFGGFKNAENQRGLIYPEYFSPQIEDYQVTVIEINYPDKFAELEHRQILGTLANSGVRRDTFGDIVHEDCRWQVAVDHEILKFFLEEIDHIGKIKVRLVPVEDHDFLSVQNDWQSVTDTVNSFRIDVLLASGFSISRTRSKELIEKRQVQLNWMTLEKPDTIIAINDVVSVRKYGRIKLVDVLGKTKKDKFKIQLDLIKIK